MKRSINSVADIGSSKRRCTIEEAAITELLHVGDILGLGSISRCCREYNRWLPFAKQHGDMHDLSNVLQSVAGFNQTLQDVRQIVTDARRQIEAKSAELERKIVTFTALLTSEPEGWYEAGDVFGM